MAVRATASITLSAVVDVSGCTRYYLLQASTLSPPNKPTTKPPTGNWSDTEPSYTSGSTNSLYITDLTVFSDGTWSYSSVSLSSSYEAAKEAYNRAQAAQSTATGAATQAGEAQNTADEASDKADANSLGIQRLDSAVSGLSTQLDVFSGGLQATIEDHSEILSAMTFTSEGLKVQMSGSIYYTLTDDVGYHIYQNDREIASFSEGKGIQTHQTEDIRFHEGTQGVLLFLEVIKLEHRTWKVYRFTFPDGKVYIGCTCQELKDRCKMKNYKGMPVYQAFSNFPKGLWQLDLLSVWDSEEAGYQAEIDAIEFYGSTDPTKGYNIARGGKGAKGVKHTEEWKRRNGDMMRGRKRSPETIAKIVAKNRGRHLPQLTRENNGFYGKRHTPETLAVISAKSRAKVFTDEIRRHMSDGKRGRPRFRAVICVEQGKRYPTLKAAAKSVGLNYSCISEAARVPHHTAGGYHWRFDEAV